MSKPNTNQVDGKELILISVAVVLTVLLGCGIYAVIGPGL